MTLKLDDKWVWDFWFAQDGADYHIFYLQAPKSLEVERLRHSHATVGHAVSQDLRHWTILPDALRPTPWLPETSVWDDYTTWTGSIIQHENLWYMLYTGAKHYEHGLVQRIGLATSTDLIQWEKHPHNPLLTTDPRWYEQFKETHWHDLAWRDPYVFKLPETGEFHAYITARANHGEHDGRGVIAHAKSADLLSWEVLPPVTAVGDFGHMEVPQWVNIGKYYYLLYSNGANNHSAARMQRLAKPPMTGTHYLMSESPLGPFRFVTDEYFAADEHGSLYSGKLIQGSDQQWYFIAFHNDDAAGNFVGEIIDPIPVKQHSDGKIELHP